MLNASLIIPQHGQLQLTLATLSTLLHWHSQLPEILIIDDHTPHAQLTRFQQRLPPFIKLIKSPKRGLTHAWITGTHAATQPVLIFLNNDVLSTGPWLQQLCDALTKAPFSIHGIHTRQQKLGSKTQSLLQGWCFALTARLYHQLNGFDPQFQLYYSDTDLQLNHLEASTLDQPLVAHVELPLIHLKHQTTSQLPSRSQYKQSDRIRFIKKWKLISNA